MFSLPEELAASLADRYRIERELGVGGMATVYLAHDLKHDRKVAIKVMRTDLMIAKGAERFLAEIRTTANLQHPHILSLIDSGAVGGTAFYVMPHVTGESLRDRLTRERQLPIQDAVRIGREVALALDYAHRQGVVHRDIKPANVLLQDGEAMVTDFGIALAASRANHGRLTETGLSLGSPMYMSPEQAVGEPTLDGRTDVYSLGCVLYEMLTGAPPFTGPTTVALIGRHALDPIPRIRTARPSVSPELERAVRRAMAKAPADRYASAAELAEALIPKSRVPLRVVARQVAMAVGATAFVGALLYWLGTRPARHTLAPLEHQRVAVAGFQPRENDPNLDAVARGLTDGLIDSLRAVPALELIKPGPIDVNAGMAAWPDSVRRALRLGALIAGSVVRTGDRYEVALWVVDGVSAVPSQSKVLEASAADVIGIQSELARLSILLLREHPHGQSDANAAWMLVQRGKQMVSSAERQTANADTTAANRQYGAADSLFAEAEQRNSRSAAAATSRAQLAYRRSRLVGRDSAQLHRWVTLGISEANRALALDPNDADALEIRGTLLYWSWVSSSRTDSSRSDTRLSAAQLDLEKATTANPRQAGAWAALSTVYFQLPNRSTADGYVAAQRAYEADPYVSNAGVILNRLFLAGYDVGNFDRADSDCAEFHRRFPADIRSLRCRLYMLSTPKHTSTDIAEAWAIADSVVARTPLDNQPRERLVNHMLVAAAIARASQSRPDLADSARHVVRASEGNAHIDSARESAATGAFVYAILGDKSDAFRLLRAHLAASPQHAPSLRDDPGWRFAALASDPRFKELVGSRDSVRRK